LKGGRVLRLNSRMSNTTLIEVRRAKPADAPAIAATHDDSWRAAYQGIIPGAELERLLNRARSLYYDGEIYELYLRPEFQGLGFGRKLFSAARRDLTQSGLQSLVVWALSDNESAVEFYRSLGGRAVARSSERFGTKVLDKVAYAWNGNGKE
jgi:GNAT superfamily N-acetyltransferase